MTLFRAGRCVLTATAAILYWNVARRSKCLSLEWHSCGGYRENERGHNALGLRNYAIRRASGSCIYIVLQDAR